MHQGGTCKYVFMYMYVCMYVLVILVVFAGTPLTEEDSDALEKLLIDNNITLTGERTYEKVVQHLHELGHEELAANLRPNLDKGG